MNRRKLKIAILLLPWIALPPRQYGGTERIVHTLTEELVKRGHDVTLFSVGDSQTSAHLSYIFKNPLGLQENVVKTLKSSFKPLMHVASCFERSREFDIIHSHAQFLALPFAAVVKTPTIHTFHINMRDLPQEEEDLLSRYGRLPFTSLSNSQRIEGVNYIDTVYNGIDTALYMPEKEPKRDYLLWVGRIVEKKGPKEAIAVAKATGIPLILAGKITETSYFEQQIKNEIDGTFIRYVGDVSDEKITDLYRNALCLLVPILWEEPFGLVMVEAMSCGTSVIAYNRGSVPEVIVNGKTGFIVDPKLGVDGLCEAVKNIATIDPKNCRQHVEEHFTIEKMVDGYEKVYEKVLQEQGERGNEK